MNMVTLQNVTAAASVALAVRDMVVSWKGRPVRKQVTPPSLANRRDHTYTIIYTTGIIIGVHYRLTLVLPFRSSVGQ